MRTIVVEARVFWIWLRCRVGERVVDRRKSPSPSRGLSIRDGALAMAARRNKIDLFPQLIASGANPAVGRHLPMRMAAANGDAAMVALLIDLCRPCEWAFDDAKDWAIDFKHSGVLQALASAQARLEANEINGALPGAPTRSRQSSRL